MKCKLRKIVINNIVYYYRYTCKYQKVSENDYNCISVFRAYSCENKNTALTVKIETVSDYYLGNILNAGVNGINFNCPSWARELILLGIDKGWNGTEKMDLLCSYEYLEQIKDNLLICKNVN